MPEREIKLTPTPGFRLPRLDHVFGELRALPDELLDLQTVYYDTPDLRLARSGASLRFREPDGWTVKLPSTSSGALLVREERAFSGTPDRPPAAAVDLLRAWVRTSHVEPVARLRTRRRRIELTSPEGKKVAEVVDDEVHTVQDGRIMMRFRELEIEITDDADEALAEAIAARLRASGAGPPDPTPKVVRALGVRASDPPDVPVRPEVGRDSSAGEVVRGAIAQSVAQLLAHDPLVRVGGDPEHVHQARVAARRLRSDLRTFRPLISAEWGAGLRDELSWLGAELGAVRDLEVLDALLRDKTLLLTPFDRPVAHRLSARIVERWGDARVELLTAMRSDRYARLLDRLVEASRAPALTTEASEPAAKVLPSLARGPWSHLVAAVGALGPEPPNASLHAVRIRAKRVRYASEAVSPVVGKPARGLARRAAALQEVLGAHQDAVIAGTWLREESQVATPSDSFAIGMLAGFVHTDEQAAREAWPDVWAKIDHKRWHTWLDG